MASDAESPANERAADQSRALRPAQRGFEKSRSWNVSPEVGRINAMSEAPFQISQRARWFIVAAIFTGVGLGLLKFFVGVLHWHYAISTLIQSEICNVLRFFVNDRWVFLCPRPTLRRLWQYHVANAAGFIVWWLCANVLKNAGSVGVSLLANFGWIWKHHRQSTAGAD
jgi:putative flippase GtrA